MQIGSTWVLTAAHCLFKDGEQVAAKTFSILLGLHDRSKTSELNRCIELKREMSSALIVVVAGKKLEWMKYFFMRTLPLLAARLMI